MADKIKGWADIHVRDGYTEGWFGQSPDEKFPKATLVIGDERVFTESEVRGMFERIAVSNAGFTKGQVQYIIHVAWDSGISFINPA